MQGRQIAARGPLAFALLLLCACAAHLPQDMEDGKPLRVEQGLVSSRFFQDSVPIKPMSLFPVLEKHPGAKSPAGTGKVLLYTGMGVGFAGGFMMGYPLGSSLGGKKFNAPLFYSGLGTVAVSLIFSKLADIKMVKAAEAYNAELGKTGLKAAFGPDGAALAWQVVW